MKLATSYKPEAFKMAVHEFSDIDNAPFDTREYSRMKFGSDRVAREFGYEMADTFYKRSQYLVESTPCVVIPAPSTTVPVAATLLSHHFMNRLNSILAQRDRDPVEWTMVHRNMTYNNNYADLPKEERKKLLANDSIYLNKEFVDGKYLIFIDDCTITGTHEEKISSYLESEDILNPHSFVCYAKYNGEDPSIEMRLNHVEIKDAKDLVHLSWERNHSVTTRSLRLLLEHPENDFENLLDAAPEDFLENTYYASIVKGYNKHGPYENNFQSLARRLGAGAALMLKIV